LRARELERRRVGGLGLERGRKVDLRRAVIVRGEGFLRTGDPRRRVVAAAGERQRESEWDEVLHGRAYRMKG
jgi:hypothetical protein